MSVVVSVEDVGPCRKQLTVEVPAPAVEAETERVVNEYGRRVRVPGFRKGKVPRHLILKRFQKDIESEVVERLLPRYWKQAEAESSIDPLMPPEVDRVDDLAPGSPLTFVATVETRPQIELRNIRDFDLPDPPAEPGQVEVEDAIDEVRRQFADWVPVDRPASRADLAVAEITEITPVDAAPAAAGEEGEVPAQPETQTIEVEVGDPRVWEELSIALQGLSAGQETTFTRTDEPDPGHAHAPDTAGDPGQGRSRRFRVRLTAVKERELPPFDDELASRVSPELKTAEELREVILVRLRRARAQQRREQRETAVLDQLRERHPMELPQGVLRQEVEHLVRDWAENLARRGVDVEHAGIDWNDTAERMQPLAEKRIQARLLLDAISEAESIAVDEKEFEATLAALARAQGVTTPALRRSLDENGRLGNLRAQLRREKTLRHLLGEAGEDDPNPIASEPAAE